MNVRLLSAISLLAATCCDSFAAEKPEKDLDIEAKAAIISTLKDPESVQFRGISRTPAGDICGEYNAKNSYGGYAGFEPFMYEKASKTLLNSTLNNIKSNIALKDLELKRTNAAEMFAQSDLLLKELDSLEKQKNIIRRRIIECKAAPGG